MASLARTNDFNLDSEGHCFFCLKKIPVKEFQATPQAQKYPVHYLARYLKMDIGKVLIEEGQRDSALLAKVRNSRLKVELCEKCTSLNSTFSGLYRQLEKLEIEIKCGLKLINEELFGADQRDKQETKQLHKLIGNELSQIVDVLREEAIQKCSQKLRVVSPRVEMENLTKKQIDENLSPHHTIPGIGNVKTESEDWFSENRIEFEGNVKTECQLPNADPDLLFDDHSRNYDMDTEVMDDEHANPRSGSPVNVNDKNLENKEEIDSPVIISAPPTNGAVVGKVKHSFNLETGRWKCSACPVELLSSTGIDFHYNSVHRKIRYRCVPCGKDFSHRHNYNRHNQSVHVGVRFKCLGCHRLFSDRSNLKAHQRKAGCMKDGG